MGMNAAEQPRAPYISIYACSECDRSRPCRFVCIGEPPAGSLADCGRGFTDWRLIGTAPETGVIFHGR